MTSSTVIAAGRRDRRADALVLLSGAGNALRLSQRRAGFIWRRAEIGPPDLKRQANVPAESAPERRRPGMICVSYGDFRLNCFTQDLIDRNLFVRRFNLRAVSNDQHGDQDTDAARRTHAEEEAAPLEGPSP